jgi:hypothetical protein
MKNKWGFMAVSAVGMLLFSRVQMLFIAMFVLAVVGAVRLAKPDIRSPRRVLELPPSHVTFYRSIRVWGKPKEVVVKFFNRSTSILIAAPRIAQDPVETSFVASFHFPAF